MQLRSRVGLPLVIHPLHTSHIKDPLSKLIYHPEIHYCLESVSGQVLEGLMRVFVTSPDISDDESRRRGTSETDPPQQPSQRSRETGSTPITRFRAESLRKKACKRQGIYGVKVSGEGEEREEMTLSKYTEKKELTISLSQRQLKSHLIISLDISDDDRSALWREMPRQSIIIPFPRSSMGWHDNQ